MVLTAENIKAQYSDLNIFPHYNNSKRCNFFLYLSYTCVIKLGSMANHCSHSYIAASWRCYMEPVHCSFNAFIVQTLCPAVWYSSSKTFMLHFWLIRTN